MKFTIQETKMTRDEISYFTNRITTGNATGIIVVLFDIYSCYADDAKQALRKGRDEKRLKEFTHAIRQASQVLRHLKNALDFKYEISKDLYALYDFCERSLARAVYSLDVTEIDNTLKIMDQIGESFRQIAKKDEAPPIMGHSQKVTAGYTYGRNDVNEMVYSDKNRGFFV